jgi:hypothetical protein
MIRSLDPLNGNLELHLGRLASDPGAMVCLLLAANALVEPYTGFTHDSRLYAVQVLERIHPGSFAGDLYLRYGSQDRYSLFTTLMASLVQFFGLHVAFFWVYLASKALLFWGLLRLTRVLISSDVALVLALIHLAIVPVAFGGNEIFHVNESFLTPRLSSCALVLLALERMLTGRMVTPVLLLLGSLLLHPLMVVGGILPAGLWWVARRRARKKLVWIALAVGTLAALVTCVEPLGSRLFGHMDDVWRTINLQICFYVRPARWTWDDWIRIAVGCAFVLAAASQCIDRSLGKLWVAILASALIGLVGSLIAVDSHFLLLIQASPYRTLWLLELLAIPAGYGLAAQLWKRGSPISHSASLFVLLLVTLRWNCDLFVLASMILLLLLGFAALYRGFAKPPRIADWLWRSTVNAFLATSGIMLLYNVIRLTTELRAYPSIEWGIHPASIAMYAHLGLFALPLIIFITGISLYLVKTVARGFRLNLLLLVFCASYQALIVWAPSCDWYGSHFGVRNRHVQFVDSRLGNRVAGHSKPLTIYWPTPVEDIWFGTGNNSYYNLAQMTGCAFNRGTAVEGYRRAALALPFELEMLAKFGSTNDWLTAFRDLLQIKGHVHFPQEEDLLRLCREEGLDFIVLKYRIKNLYCATDGYYYIYDCEQLRRLRSEAGVHGEIRSDGRPANNDDSPSMGEGKISGVTLRRYGRDIP